MEPGPLPAWTEAQGRALQNIQRVEQAVQMAARRGLHRVTMDLSPPDLGRVTVELRFRDGTLAARIQTENLEARAALQAGVQQLRANLEAQGVRLENFDVTQDEQSPLPDGRGHSGGRQGGEDGGESPAEGGAPSFDPEAEAEVLVAAMRDDSASAGAGALNVVA
jgi:flagellar hook-length control protein FliK